MFNTKHKEQNNMLTKRMPISVKFTYSLSKPPGPRERVARKLVHHTLGICDEFCYSRELACHCLCTWRILTAVLLGLLAQVLVDVDFPDLLLW